MVTRDKLVGLSLSRDGYEGNQQLLTLLGALDTLNLISKRPLTVLHDRGVLTSLTVNVKK